MTIARAHLVDPTVSRWYHCVTRCVRRAFLARRGTTRPQAMDRDAAPELAEIFAISVGGFSILDNHLHLLVRLDPERRRAGRRRARGPRPRSRAAPGGVRRLGPGTRRPAAGLEEFVALALPDRGPAEARFGAGRDGGGVRAGSYLQLVDYTARLYRAGKAAVLREVAAILDRLGNSADVGSTPPEDLTTTPDPTQAQRERLGGRRTRSPSARLICEARGQSDLHVLWGSEPAHTRWLKPADAATGDGDRGPVVARQDAGDEDDLPDVVAAVGQRALDRQRHGMRLATDGHGPANVARREARQGVEQPLPAGLPIGDQFVPCGERVHELVVPVAPGLLAVRGEEVGPPGQEVPGDVLHDDGDAVRVRVEGDVQWCQTT